MCSYATSRHPRGAALVITMLVMAVLLLAGTTFLTISSTETQIALNQQVSARALFFGEAGVRQAIAQLNANSGYAGETYQIPGGGSYTITINSAAVQTCPANDARDVDVVTRVPVGLGQAQTELRATVDRVSYPFQWGAFGIEYLYLLNLGAQSTTDSFDSTLGSYSVGNIANGGHLGSNSYLAPYSVQVHGDLRSGDVIWTWNTTVSGTQTEKMPQAVFPSPTPGAMSCSPLNVASGVYNLANGTYCFTTINFGDDTSLTTSGGPVTVYVPGPGVQNANGDYIIGTIGKRVVLGNVNGTGLTLITKSDGPYSDMGTVKIDTDFKFYGALYGTNTSLWFGDRAAIYGSIIGRRIFGTYPSYWNNSAPTIHYDHAMAQRPLCHNGNYAVRHGTWREITP